MTNHRLIWEQTRAAWLNTYRSANTRRVYERSSYAWLKFCAQLGVAPWAATPAHVEQWQTYLREEQGLSGSTVNLRLAACSSLYALLKEQTTLITQNPFAHRSIQREQIPRYSTARILTLEETDQLLTHLEARKETLYGSRNYALLLTFLLTGYRPQQVVSMQWGQIRPNRSAQGGHVFVCGHQVDPLPALVHQAILDHADKRQAARDKDEYIWQPLNTGGLTNLKNQDGAAVDANRHISLRSVLRILQTSLRKAGVSDWADIRTRDLRHTFAHRLWESGADLERLRRRLHLQSRSTAQQYARHVLEDPVDDWSDEIYQGLRSGE